MNTKEQVLKMMMIMMVSVIMNILPKKMMLMILVKYIPKNMIIN